MPTPPNWRTSSYGHAPDTSPGEWSSLVDHLHLCQRAAGRLFTLKCGGEALRGFLTARIVTTGLALALLIGGMAWLG